MTIRVNVDGHGVVEFEDGTPDSVIDSVIQRDFFPRGVADRARARLADQGLTPEQVKTTNAGVASPDDFRLDQPKTADGGFLSNMLGAMNPLGPIREQVHEMAQDARRMRGEQVPDVPLHPDIGVPDFGEIAKESYRRGEANESRAGMYGGAVGSALLAGAAMLPARAIGAAPEMAARAEGQYARAVSTPLTESLATSIAPEMMDRVGVVRDPAKIANTATAAESSLSATREAIPKPRGKFVDGEFEPSTLDDWSNSNKRDTVARQAKFHEDVRTIAEALPEQRSIGNILIDGLKKKKEIAMTAGLATLIPGVGKVVAGIAGGVAAKQVLGELTSSVAFKTASAMAKRSFAKALQAGDHATAAEIGAGIVAGAYSDDDYGHAGAVRALSEKTSALPTPELRRQAVAATKAVYVNPDGREILVPSNVMAGFASAGRLSETESPMNAWLNAMGKQGLIKKGGELRFTDAGGGVISSPAAKSKELPENDALIFRRKDAKGKPLQFAQSAGSLERLLPERFVNARTSARNLASPISGVIDIGGGKVGGNGTADAMWGARFDTGKVHLPYSEADLSNSTLISRKAATDSISYTHEIGHPIYSKDFSDAERSTWDREVHRIDTAIRAEVNANPNVSSADVMRILAKYPKSVTQMQIDYRGDPKRINAEAFSETFGQFITDPSKLKAISPATYDVMRRLIGREYIGRK